MRECLKREISYKTSRSSGPGGQHVNKSESRVELAWSLVTSECLNESQKLLVKKKLAARLTQNGALLITSQRYRSQFRNKEEVTERFLLLISGSLVPEKKRTLSRPTRASVEKRIKNKKIKGEIKRSRRHKPDD